MTNPRGDQTKNGKARGLRPSLAKRCPRVVAGRRCTRFHSDEPCICQQYFRLFDHGRMWIDEDGTRVLTGEPYYIDAPS